MKIDIALQRERVSRIEDGRRGEERRGEGDENPPVETEVETWGYPLRYQDSQPVLSRGYVAGYTMGRDLNGQPKNPPVRHLIVNGALNPGKSGGPLIDRASGKVIGIVVEKWRLFSPDIEAVITALQHS